jgi:hypothetical protein
MDTRKKISLGGLIIKAELQSIDPQILYGMLLDSKKIMEAKPDIINKWAELGKNLTRD